jgi:signal transduction histidine kinase
LEAKEHSSEMLADVSFSELINEVKSIFNKLIIEGNIRFKYDFTRANSVITLKTYLASILYNLISNSIKYRQPGTELLIEIESYKEDCKTILLFKDNGKGIDMEKNSEKIFGLYQRFDNTVEGKGMGLFMIKNQVESMDGNISVRSEINKGTEFRIEFPDMMK